MWTSHRADTCWLVLPGSCPERRSTPLRLVSGTSEPEHNARRCAHIAVDALACVAERHPVRLD